MGEKENSPKWTGWMEAWWMSFSFRLSIYHSWFPGEYGWIRWSWLLYDNSFAPALGGACAMGTDTIALIQTCQIQAIMTVPKRLSFSARLSNCNLATCRHIELNILGLLHPSISIHLINSFSCSMKFFFGLALGESCVGWQKNTDVHKGMLRWESFP